MKCTKLNLRNRSVSNLKVQTFNYPIQKLVYQDQEKARWENTFPALISHQDTLYRKTLAELHRIAVSLRDITINYGAEMSKNAHNFVHDCDEPEERAGIREIMIDH